MPHHNHIFWIIISLNYNTEKTNLLGVFIDKCSLKLQYSIFKSSFAKRQHFSLKSVENPFTIRKKHHIYVFPKPLHLSLVLITFLCWQKPVCGLWFKVAGSGSSWCWAKLWGCSSELWSRRSSAQHLLASSSQLELLNPIYRDRRVNYSEHQ